jgi:hypothetical protein
VRSLGARDNFFLVAVSYLRQNIDAPAGLIEKIDIHFGIKFYIKNSQFNKYSSNYDFTNNFSKKVLLITTVPLWRILYLDDEITKPGKKRVRNGENQFSSEPIAIWNCLFHPLYITFFQLLKIPNCQLLYPNFSLFSLIVLQTDKFREKVQKSI